jgi:PPE-repeat protein
MRMRRGILAMTGLLLAATVMNPLVAEPPLPREGAALGIGDGAAGGTANPGFGATGLGTGAAGIGAEGSGVGGLGAAGLGAAGIALPGAPPPTALPIPAALAGGEGILMFASATESGGQMITLVETRQRWIASYAVEPSGQIRLLSSRPLGQDFSVEFNAASPTPREIRTMMAPSR